MARSRFCHISEARPCVSLHAAYPLASRGSQAADYRRGRHRGGYQPRSAYISRQRHRKARRSRRADVQLRPSGGRELNSSRGLSIARQPEVIAMKLSIVAMAAVLALCSPAVAQSDRSDGLNGATLGKSMPGSNNGVPYPNPATDGAARVRSGGWSQHGATSPRYHHHHYGYHNHHHHHRHHKHH